MGFLLKQSRFPIKIKILVSHNPKNFSQSQSEQWRCPPPWQACGLGEERTLVGVQTAGEEGQGLNVFGSPGKGVSDEEACRSVPPSASQAYFSYRNPPCFSKSPISSCKKHLREDSTALLNILPSPSSAGHIINSQ